jgi:hypothetical protein
LLSDLSIEAAATVREMTKTKTKSFIGAFFKIHDLFRILSQKVEAQAGHEFITPITIINV